jgi:hypothetical protein
MPGPPRKDPATRRRRNAPPETTKLPALGRKGRPPAWPLSKMRVGESAVWRSLWATPQAVAWQRLGWTRVVARYCRCIVLAENDPGLVSLLAEVRQLEDRLGLSPMAMRRLQWEVDGADELAEARERRTVSATPRRLRAVDPGAVAGS